MSKLKLYGGAKNRGRRCYWLAKELGLEIEAVEIDLASGQHRSPEFLKINPNGQVPVLDDDGFILYESLAINLYLVKKQGGPLAAASLQEEARFMQWSLWVVNEIEHLLIAILEHRMMLPEGERRPALADDAWRKLQKPLGVLEQTLTDRDYLVGNRFTVADLNVSIVMSLINRLSLDITRYPNVRAWLDTCLGRPAGKGFV
ncbi:glutathione S-transferase family protein [Dongia sp.]|uniref:glutathione S-transferase family protein n=1 Tax=Dongia sp. TaxID=1977262 RepID=UPI003753B0E4